MKDEMAAAEALASLNIFPLFRNDPENEISRPQFALYQLFFSIEREI
jgi:hypothetical protein